MTPYMTPHTSQTPRYGQMTPAQNSGFARPGAPVSGNRGGNFRESPFSSGASPRGGNMMSSRGFSSQNQESMDWQQAADAWGAPRNNKGTTPRDTMAGRITPRR